jgi:hypothetical protein
VQPYGIVRMPQKEFATRWLNLVMNAQSGLAVVLRARRGSLAWLVITGKRSVYNAALFRSLL